MNFVRSFMGRRQFLTGAVAASAAGLASKTVSGMVSRRGDAGMAHGAENSGSSAVGAFSDRYRHLLSPLAIGNVVLKNRMMHTRSLPHFLMGPETFPSEQVISHYAGVAASGAAIVTCLGGRKRDRSKIKGFLAHMMIWDVDDAGVQNYFSQLADAIHFHGSLASVGLTLSAPSGYNISSAAVPFSIGRDSEAKEIPVELIQEFIDGAASQAQFYQSLGFDMVNIYMPYNASLLAHAMSPVINRRTDRYGGSLENRARLPLELFQAIKKACGPDFLIEAHISGTEGEGGYTLADTVAYAKIWDGALDILQLRQADKDDSHPMGWNATRNEHVTLGYAEAVKKSGVKMMVAPNGGFQDPDLNNAYIADGRADIIAMARTWIADPDYGQKVCEGRGEDVVPCICCNKCHGHSSTGPFYSFCSVNPKLGVAHRLGRMIDPPGVRKKVAVIGGGPAGMKAALTAAERGHAVTLYEKSDSLGGLLRHADHTPYGWPLKDFKEYLIRQVEKAGIEVKMKTEATPEMIRARGCDAVIAATGAAPVVSKISGAEGKNAWNIFDAYANEDKMGKRVVVIGGGKIGAEFGMYMAATGHSATVMSSGKVLVPPAGPHQIQVLETAYATLTNFHALTEVLATEISNGKVLYTDAGGSKKSIAADSVVIYAGFKSLRAEALTFSGTAPRFFMAGDCRAPGNLATCNRTAFTAASQI